MSRCDPSHPGVHRPARRRPVSFWLGAVLGCLAAASAAAPNAASAPAAVPAPVTLAGTALDGRHVDLARLRGKVLMVFYWNSACVVCLQKMPELRANAAGWRGKPFELILVSTDRRRADVEAYMRTVRAVEPDSVNFAMLWTGTPGYADTLAPRAERLPLTLVVDTKGQVVQRHEGRMAPEAWDAVADLLP